MTTAQSLMRGLEIILKYEPDTEIAAEHDVIYAGTLGVMTEEHRLQMLGLGWREDDFTESWAFYP